MSEKYQLKIKKSDKKTREICFDNETIKDRLSTWLNHLISTTPNSPKQWIAHQDKFIDAMIDYSPEHCLDLLLISSDGLAHVPTYETARLIPLPYNVPYLIDIAECEDWESLTCEAFFDGYPMLKYGYRALQALFGWRVWIYLFQAGTLDQTYAEFSDDIRRESSNEEDIEDIKESIERLCLSIQGNYRTMIDEAAKKKPGKLPIEIDIPEENRNDIFSALGVAMKDKNLPKDKREFILAAMEGRPNIKYIPYAAACDLLDCHDWQKEDAMKGISMSIGPIPITEVDRPDENPYNNTEELKITGQLLDLLKNPLDKKIAQLKVDGYSEEKIACKLSIAPNTVTNRMHKIKNRLSPYKKS